MQAPVGYHAVSNLVLSPHELRYSVLPTRSMKDEVEYSYSPISFNETLSLIGRTPLHPAWEDLDIPQLRGCHAQAAP